MSIRSLEQLTKTEALGQVLACFAARDDVTAELLAGIALHAGVGLFDVADGLLRHLDQVRAEGAEVLEGSDVEMRASRLLFRLSVPRPPRGARVLLFTDKPALLHVAFHAVVSGEVGEVRVAVTPDPADLLTMTTGRLWDAVVVDHVGLRRSARTTRAFLQPLLGGLRETRVVVTTQAFDDRATASGGVGWVARDLRQMVTAAGAAINDPLTVRERAVLEAVAQGRSNEQIGRQLDLALGTVKTYLERIHGKLGSVDRASAVAIALRRGWL